MRALFPLTFLALCTVVAFASCKSNDIAASNANTVNIGQACNVDASTATNGCGGGVCLAGYCRQPCSSDSACSGDAAVGGRCLTSRGVSGCALEGDLNCTPGAGCPQEFLCGSDFACHTKCTTDAVCLNGQVCQAGACYPVASNGSGQDGSVAPQDASESGSGSSSGSNSSGSSGSGSSSGASDAAGSPDTSGLPDTSFVSTCTGQALTQFGHIATGDSNTNYTTGVAVRTPSEMLIFSAYFGPDRATPADAGTPANVAQIDVQHFDLTTGKKTGASGPLQTTDVDGSAAPFTPGPASNMGLYSAAVGLTPTGGFAIAMVYGVAGLGGGFPALFVSFLDSSLTVQQTTQIAAYGNDESYAHVRWENGEFVVSWTYFTGGTVGLKVAKFQYDGSNSGSTGAVPTDDPNGYVHLFGGYIGDQGSVAFTSGVFAVAYANAASIYPMLTLLDPNGAQVGGPVRLPPYAGSGIYAEDFVTVAATAQGFIALYDGTVVSDAGAGPPSVLATFVSPSGMVGGTYSFPGGPAYENFGAARGAGDGNGAGFVVQTPGGAANFLYFTGDGSTHLNPQTVLQQANAASQNDLVSIMSLPGSANGSFAVGLYSSGEHLTRMAVSGCPPRAGDAGP